MEEEDSMCIVARIGEFEGYFVYLWKNGTDAENLSKVFGLVSFISVHTRCSRPPLYRTYSSIVGYMISHALNINDHSFWMILNWMRMMIFG